MYVTNPSYPIIRESCVYVYFPLLIFFCRKSYMLLLFVRLHFSCMTFFLLYLDPDVKLLQVRSVDRQVVTLSTFYLFSLSFVDTDRVELNGTVSDCCSGSAWFESRMENLLSSQKLFVSLVSSLDKC
jgi:hypothetical protein